MSSRERVENRAQAMFEYLSLHINEGFRIGELCEALSLNDSATTRSAIRRARELATEAGYHFPPAIYANGFTYKVTDLPHNAMAPAAQMGRIETGVRARKENGIEFLRRERRNLPADLRPIADMQVQVFDSTRRALAEIVESADSMVLQIMRVRGVDVDREPTR